MSSDEPMKIDLSDGQMKALIREAILVNITDKQREEILSRAVVDILTPKERGYGSRPTTPLESAMRYAIDKVSNEIAEEVLRSSPETMAIIRQTVSSAMLVAVRSRDEFRKSVVSNLSSAITKLIDRDDD